jgi:uncharacterized protein YijF (DUF1287 family)
MKFHRLMVTLCCAPLAVAAAPIKADGQKLADAARAQIGVTLAYDPSYRRLDYPNGDVPLATGVCADVVIRALRRQGIDLQQLVHEDMAWNFPKYPRHWGLKSPDRNIDHRRVPNLMTFFSRRGNSVAISARAADYRAGDLVAWNLNPGGFLPHVGIVSDRTAAGGEPLVIHNIGAGVREEPVLFQYKIIGHYRL